MKLHRSRLSAWRILTEQASEATLGKGKGAIWFDVLAQQQLSQSWASNCTLITNAVMLLIDCLERIDPYCEA